MALWMWWLGARELSNSVFTTVGCGYRGNSTERQTVFHHKTTQIKLCSWFKCCHEYYGQLCHTQWYKWRKRTRITILQSYASTMSQEIWSQSPSVPQSQWWIMAIKSVFPELYSMTVKLIFDLLDIKCQYLILSHYIFLIISMWILEL